MHLTGHPVPPGVAGGGVGGDFLGNESVGERSWAPHSNVADLRPVAVTADGVQGFLCGL